VKLGHVVSEICWHTDRQTDKSADTLITILFHPLPRANVQLLSASTIYKCVTNVQKGTPFYRVNAVYQTVTENSCRYANATKCMAAKKTEQHRVVSSSLTTYRGSVKMRLFLKHTIRQITCVVHSSCYYAFYGRGIKQCCDQFVCPSVCHMPIAH